MTNSKFNPFDYQCRGTPNRISSYNLIDNSVLTEKQWVDDILKFLPYQTLLTNTGEVRQDFNIGHMNRIWLSENCNNWWTDTSLLNYRLLEDNILFPDHVLRGDSSKKLFSVIGRLHHYAFQNKDDAIMFKLYVNG